MADKCNTLIRAPRGWSSSRCRKPVKGTDSHGNEVCGIHLRQDAQRIKRNEEFIRQGEIRGKLKLRVEALGLTTAALFSDEKVLISLEELEELVRAK